MAVNQNRNVVENEPVVTAGVIAGVIITVASLFGVILDFTTVQTAVAAVIPVITAVFARQRVTPVK